MTYDLSNTISEGYEGLGPVISKILHAVTPLVAGEFIRQQGQTQGLPIVGMLDSGVRFIDFRIMLTDPPDSVKSHKEWRCLHGCESRQTALTYLKEVRGWLDEHPKEILVFVVSRHMSLGLTGTDQYPATTPEDRQRFFAAVQGIFGELLLDASAGRLNETSVAELWRRGQRVVWYAADYEQSTNRSSRALDASPVQHNGHGRGWDNGTLLYLRNGAAYREAMKAKNQYQAMALQLSADVPYIEDAALITFLPLSKHWQVKKCAKWFGIPGLTDWCPLNLQEIGLLDNFYNQRQLEAAYVEGASNLRVDFPMAIYVDAIDTDGRFRTGTQRLNPLPSDSLTAAGFSLGEEAPLRAAGKTDTVGYAFSQTLIGATVRRLCRGAAAAAPACGELLAAVQRARAKYPVFVWDDVPHGRRSDWPPLPTAAGGFVDHLLV